MNSLSDSPYTRSAQQLTWLVFIFFVIGIQPSLTRTLGAWAVVPLPFLVATIIYLAARSDSRPQTLRAIHGLQRRLPWFTAQPVTCHELPPAEQLAAALAAEDYQAIEIDGERVASWAELATTLQAHTGAMRWPEDPRRKVRALLARLAQSNPRRQALVWRNADHSARHDVALVGAFIADWSAEAMVQPTGLLVFVDLSSPVRTIETEHVVMHSDRATERPQVDRKILAQAPATAWWHPEPGELTKRR